MRISRSAVTLGSFLLCLTAGAWIAAGWQARAAAQSPQATPQTEPATAATTLKFPPSLVDFTAGPKNPVFTAQGPGHWDVKIRERGWIMKEGPTYHMWYTGYDGTPTGTRLLGYATSSDGLSWKPDPGNPLIKDHWVEDMMVVKQGETYYMFAEGLNDQAQLLTSRDRVHWTRQGTLDIRYTNGKPLTPGPFGTPAAWYENGTWYLFYERLDAGIWLATSKDLKVWTHVQDAPVLVPGPDEYDAGAVAFNQVIKRDGQYFAYYHGSLKDRSPRPWTPNVATSTDLVHWVKYPKNPLVPGNKSSCIVVDDGKQFVLYTMHNEVDVYFPSVKGR